MEEIKLESTSLLAYFYAKQGQYEPAKQILRKSLDKSSHLTFWHCKLLFQLSQIHAYENDFMSAANVLSAGADFASMGNAPYTRCLFILSKGMMLMVDRRFNEVRQVLIQAQQLLEAWQGNTFLKESLKVFFLTLQVCHHLNAGQVSFFYFLFIIASLIVFDLLSS